MHKRFSTGVCGCAARPIIGSLITTLGLSLGLPAASHATPEAEEARTAETAAPQGPVRDVLAPDGLLPQVASAPRRRELPIGDVPGSVTVIGRAEIERRQLRTLADVLREVPGLHVVQSGPLGKQTSIFTRGTDSNHTLVLLDGIEIADPSSPSSAFDAADFVLDNVERVEVLRGPQSALYGSDAIGGVVQIVTRRGRGEPRLRAQVEGGAYGTFQQSAGFHGGSERFDYALGYSQVHTRGFSVLDADLGGHERDGYDNRTTSARVGFAPAPGARVDLVGRFVDADTDLDPGAEDRDSRGANRQLFLRSDARFELLGGRWQPRVGVAFSDHDRRLLNEADLLNPGASASSFDGRKLEIDLQNDFFLAPGWVLTVGGETERETFTSRSLFSDPAFGDSLGAADASVRTSAGYAQLQAELVAGLEVIASGRLEHHDEYGSQLTYRTAIGYVHPETGTRVFGNVGTGFKAPALNELFDQLVGRDGDIVFPLFFGNPDLEPERSRGFEIGVEQPLLDGRLRVGTTYFQNRIRNLINSTFDFTSLMNVDRARTDGFETFVSFALAPTLYVRLDHTYTSAEDRDTGEQLLRRPSHLFTAKLEARPLEAVTLSVVQRYVGHRKDVGNVSLGGYSVVNVAATYAVSPELTLFGRIDNLFDKDYLDPDTFESGGFAGYLGVAFTTP